MSSKLSKVMRAQRGASSANGDGSKRFSIPASIIHCEGPVARVFTIQSMGICTVTANGAVTIWSFNGKVKLLDIYTEIDSVIAAELILSNDPSSYESWLLIQSRSIGIRIFRFTPPTPLTAPSPSEISILPLPFQYSFHAGFCSLQLFQDVLTFPSGQNTFGIVSLAGLKHGIFLQQRLPGLVKEEVGDGIIMFVKVVHSFEGEEFFIYGTEPGTVKVATIIRVLSDNQGTEQVVIIPWKNTLNLNAFKKISMGSNNKQCRQPEQMMMMDEGGAVGGAVGGTEPSDFDEDEIISPLCCDVFPHVDAMGYGNEQTAIIGTNTKYVYKLKMDGAAKTLDLEYRKRFPNKGVSCMDVHPNGRILVTGGWDGGIRVSLVNDLSQLMYIPYHVKMLTSVKFFNSEEGRVSDSFNIICSSLDGQVSVWNTGEKLYQAS